MKTSLLALQTKLYEALASHTPLMSKVTGIYDDAPKAKTPYVTIGNPTVNDWSSKTFNGEDITFTLHVWSDYKGKKEVYEIFDLLLTALTEPLVINDVFEMEFQRREFMEVLDDNLSGQKHGILRLRFRISQ